MIILYKIIINNRYYVFTRGVMNFATHLIQSEKSGSIMRFLAPADPKTCDDSSSQLMKFHCLNCS